MTGALRRTNLALRLGTLGLLMLFSHRIHGVMNSMQVDHRRTQESPSDSTSEADAMIGAPSFDEKIAQQSAAKSVFAQPAPIIATIPSSRDEISNESKQGNPAELPTANATNVANRRKRGRRKRRAENSVSPAKLKVPLPIFVPSLPKSGTTSIHEYFLCGGQNSAHHVYRIDGKVRNKIGRCWQQNIKKGNPPLSGCGTHDIWSDTGYVGLNYRKGLNKTTLGRRVPCYYPLLQSLDQIYESYPNSTFLFVTREETSWLNSIQTYHEGFIVDVWKQCRIDGFPGRNATLEDFRGFFRWHTELLRKFAKDHPSITYIEMQLEAENTGQSLEERIGVDRTCWGHHNKQHLSPM